MVRGVDQRGIRRGHSQGRSARREQRSELPSDFDDLREDDESNNLGLNPHAGNVTMPLDERDEAQAVFDFVAGHESPASSLLIFGDDHSAFSSVSSVSPTSVAQVVGLDGALGRLGEEDATEKPRQASAVHKKKRAFVVSSSSLSVPPPALESIDLLELIEGSCWKELSRAIVVLALPLSDHDLVARALSSTNAGGETPVHTLAWKAPTELVLQALNVRGVSSCLTMCDRDLNTPLHLACANVTNRSEFAVIRNMANLAPQALALQNEHGDTPLHLLVSSQAFIRSNDFLAEAEAAALLSHLFSLPSNLHDIAVLANRDEATMLHICLAVGAHERVILKVLDAAPDAARRKDHFGYLPLHYVAAFGGTPWPVVAKLIDAFPESIRATTSDGDTPLHLLMSNGAKFLREQSRSAEGSAAFLDRNTTKLAELLMGEEEETREHEMNDDSQTQETSRPLPPLLMVNQSDLTPLHVSACFESPPQLIKILMESTHGPKAVMTTTSLGYTPLHLACAGIRKHKAGKSKSSKRLLASVEALATPDACAARDSLGRTPLMLAVQNRKAEKHVIRALIRVLPSSVEHRTANGYLPVHLAVQSKYASESVVRTLITEYPKSVYEKSHKGETVLHVACLVAKIPYDVVDLLVRKYPGAVDCANASHELPIDRARAIGASKKVVALLLDASSKNLRTTDSSKGKKSNKASAVSRSSIALSTTDANARTVGFFAPQVREPSSRSRSAAPDPPTESPTVISRPTDPTPIRRRGRTPEPSQSLLRPSDQRLGATKSTAPTKLGAEKQRSVVLVEPVSSASRESRSRDRKAFAGRRAMSVSQDMQSVNSKTGLSELNRRARTRSPARTPGLDRRAKSEANLQPRIARKRVTRLSKGESTSAISKGDVYRFEI